MLALPFVVFAPFGAFFRRAALALTLVFVAVPIGVLFGSTLSNTSNGRRAASPIRAADAFFLAGLCCWSGAARPDRATGLRPALGAGLLFALALFLRPNLAPAAGVLLGGAGLAALWHRRLRRVAGLCLGFLPVLGMALHNWVFGGVFVLFSANATIHAALPMPPSAYLAALGELFTSILPASTCGAAAAMGALARRALGIVSMVPLHVAAIAVLVRVASSRRFDPWLRLTAWAAIAQHPVAWFYPVVRPLLLSDVVPDAAGVRGLAARRGARHARGAGLAGAMIRQLRWREVRRITTLGRMLDGLAALAGIGRRAGAPVVSAAERGSRATRRASARRCASCWTNSPLADHVGRARPASPAPRSGPARAEILAIAGLDKERMDAVAEPSGAGRGLAQRVHGARRKAGLLQQLARAALGRGLAGIDQARRQFPGEGFQRRPVLPHERDRAAGGQRDDRRCNRPARPRDRFPAWRRAKTRPRARSRSIHGEIVVMRRALIFGHSSAIGDPFKSARLQRTVSGGRRSKVVAKA